MQYWHDLRDTLHRAIHTPASFCLVEAISEDSRACRTCGLYYLRLYNWQALKSHVLHNVSSWYSASPPAKTAEHASKPEVSRKRTKPEAHARPPRRSSTNSSTQTADADTQATPHGTQKFSPLLEQSSVHDNLSTHESMKHCTKTICDSAAGFEEDG